MDGSPPGSSVHGVFQQEYWSGLPFPPPRALSDPGIKPTSPALQVDSLPRSHLGRNCRLPLLTVGRQTCFSTQPNSIQLLLPSKSFSRGAYIALQNKNWPEPRKYIMARMRSSLGDLSCYVTVQRHYLQNVK